ncbi:MAG: ribonuclease Z [Nanoarchaeota archaeon]|nr:ribonuclease Z [Nanoarchaeota archaeon]
MENIKLTFLGTGNAIPTKMRNHTSILLSFRDENILIDCGEGTQRQFRYAGISPCKLTRILITHWHGDHVLGLPGLLQTLAMSEYKGVLKIYGPKGTKKMFSLVESMIFGLKIRVEVNEIGPGVFIDRNEFLLEAQNMEHGIPCNAYSFILKDKRRLDKSKLKKLKLPNSPLLKDLQQGKDIVFNGKKIKVKDVSYTDKGKKVVFILDSALNDKAFSIAKGADLLVSEASFSSTEIGQAKEYKHLTAQEAAQIAKKASAKKLVLTHLSQRYEHNPKIILNEAKNFFKNSILVKDLDSIII